MALSRAFLNGMGLTAEQVTAIVEAHSETVNAIKAEVANYKEQAEGVADKDAEIKNLKKEVEELKAKGTDNAGWEEKYNTEHSAFEAYKAQVAESETKRAKETAYRNLLTECGVSEKRHDSILKITDLSTIDIDKDGAVKGKDKLAEGIKAEWSDFIKSSQTQGAGTQNPPGGGSATGFEAMSLTDKMVYANEHPNDAEVLAWLKK